MSPREDSLPLPLPRKRLSSLPDTFHALPLLSGSSHNKHGESLYKSIQFSCTPLFTRHPHEPFVTVGLGVPPRGLGLGASYFDMLGSKYCFQCAFFICCRKYQAHIYMYLQLKERFLSPVLHYVLPRICFEAFVFVLLNNVDNHKVRHQNGLKRFCLYKLLASEFFSLLTW